MLDVGAEALEAGQEDLLLLSVEHVLRVEDRRRIEGGRHRRRILLERLIGEDVVKLIAETHVVDQAGVLRCRKVRL